MVYNTKWLLKDATGKPIPQIYIPSTDAYESIAYDGKSLAVL